MAKRNLSIPIIDLGATFKVIDESATPPQWQTIARGYATKKVAQRLIKKHDLSGIWMIDDLGYKSYISR